ncbi:homoserine dehydrogenase [Maritalea sp.]|uniref:homoserine dehydrogenase n=1 Tax=Maritalea sp. TaxID=2003361 RepID=UPI003EF83236
MIKTIEKQSTNANAPIRIGVAGVGTVGAALVSILQSQQDDVQKRFGRDIEVTAVCARSRSRDRGVDMSEVEWFDDPVALAKSSSIDLYVELMGGEDGPALASIRAALEAGIPVVTANKALIAKHGVEIARLAEKHNTSFNFEAAVAGGIPVIKTLREGLGLARVQRVYGIMNGTCNYILTRMSNEEISFASCLKDAQELGYAEADPTFDIEGFDTAHKLAILTSLCFGVEIAADQMFVEGITRIDQADIKVADDLGFNIKLLGVAQRTSDGIEQRVHPTLVPKTSTIAGIDGVMNAVALETNHVQELLMAGPGAGGEATAASVLADIFDSARGTLVPPLGMPVDQLAPYQKASMRAHEGGYFIRLNARDIPGALAAIASRMGESDISLESVIQRPDLVVSDPEAGDVATRTVVLITQETMEQTVRQTLDRVAKDGFIVGTPQVIRIERF